MEDPIRILLVDDSRIYMEGIKTILKSEEKNMEITMACDCQEAMSYVNVNIPDIVILDANLEEDMDGIELAHRLKDECPKIKVIIMSHYKDIRYIINALKAKVRAYLAKDSFPEEVINTIYSVMKMKKGGLYWGETISEQTVEKLINTYYGTKENLEKDKPYNLSKREIQIIEYLTEGMSSKKIASELHIDTKTIESHKENIKGKLNVKSVVEIVVFSIRNKIISID